MRYRLVTLSCPDGHGQELSFELPASRIMELREEATQGDASLEAILRQHLQQGHGQCPYCDTPYRVDVGSSVETDSVTAETGP